MPSRSSDVRVCAALFACALVPALAGCARKTVHAAAPAAPISAEADRPMTTAPDTSATPPVDSPAPPPALQVTSAPAPPPVAIPTTKPSAPRKPAGGQPAAEIEPAPASHPPAPQISPQLSPGDQAAYQRKTGDDISAAESNLQRAAGKQLNATQQDLTEKIRSFLSQSR